VTIVLSQRVHFRQVPAVRAPKCSIKPSTASAAMGASGIAIARATEIRKG